MKIVFLDIDGPMIPTRAYMMAGQTKPIVTQFDPCAVGLLNQLCRDTGAKIVVHSSWRKSALWQSSCAIQTVDLVEHLVNQGIELKHLHDEWCAPFKFSSNRWHEIGFWLTDAEEDGHAIESYVIIEDESLPYGLEEKYADRHCQIDFHEGFTYAKFVEARIILERESTK